MRGWEDHGACVGMDPAIFFPERGESVDEAKKVCASCPVLEQCRAEHGVSEIFGTWAGTTERERRTLRIRARRLSR